MQILFIFGTRPEAIKMIPLILESRRRNYSFHVCVTGQHKMVDDLLKQFNIIPDFNLKIMKKNQTINYIIHSIISSLEKIIKNRYDYVFVHGDTTSALASSLWAFNNKMKVAHVEAGLRSYEKYDPFPEEMNRVLIDQISSYHFCPTLNNKKNLLKENIQKNNICVCGNTVIDMAKIILDNNNNKKSENPKQVIVTCHRRENIDKMDTIFESINEIALTHPNIEFKFPVHPNPIINVKAKKFLKANNIKLLKPLDYVDFIIELSKSKLIITDSGGVLEEASFLNKNVLIIRNSLERKELLCKNVIQTKTKKNDIINSFNKLIKTKPSSRSSVLGKGDASSKILDFIEKDINE